MIAWGGCNGDAGDLPEGLQRRERGLSVFGVALALGVAVVVTTRRAAALHALRRLGLDLLLALGHGVVVDVVVVDVLGGLLGDEALAQEGTGGQRGRAWWQLARGQAVGRAGAGAVPAHAGGLAAGGLQHSGQVLVQDGLGVLLVAARGQERQRVLGVLGVGHVPAALQAGGELGTLLLLVLPDKGWQGMNRRGRELAGHTPGCPPPRGQGTSPLPPAGNANPTSLICCSLSSRQSMVSCSCFSFSRREMSSAAKAAGSTGVISLGRRCVLYKERGQKAQGKV